MTRAFPMSQRCTAHNRQGAQCGHLAMRAQTVCRYHGGKNPHALANAEARMRDLVHPAISSLDRLIGKDEFAATRYVLDWAGFRPADQPQSTSEATLSVTVHFDHATTDDSPTLRLTDAD